MLYSDVAGYVREFLYIEDIIGAYKILFEHGIQGEAYNVGGTPPQRIGAVISMIRDKINPEMEIDIVDKSFDEIKEQYLNADKIKSLGWKSNVELSDGLDRTIAWYKNYRENGGQW